ncbi:hypothetical protein COLO4_01649 [Corchorus olitorius]|uniref:Uncharacterized protein n=1 Tax=Corchorus olitorius TaxID=93759 RepID=A0A1R3L140_9ROSI|nr:hypothetical protein COLO4_02380 [Corchorus olitorius]OMP13457.1 hypothetical protein COLO4_01649 [Corchorus olitorius]
MASSAETAIPNSLSDRRTSRSLIDKKDRLEL